MNTIVKGLFAATLMTCGLATVPASAATIVGATTLASPTYNRPLTTTSLSGVGTAVHYQTSAFTVATSGSYSFLMSAITPVDWDTYLSLYSNSFVPGSPLANLLAVNDDAPTIGLSGFNFNLLAGTSYFAVATGFANTDVGTYSLAINGPGAVTFGNTTAVPEPASWAMMLAGFGLMGFAMRRKSKVKTTVKFA